MNKINIAICEDNEKELQHLLNVIHSTDIPVNCTAFKNGEDFLDNYEIGLYDLIFMDIYMDNLTGVDTIKALREIDPTVLVAFTTTSLDFTLEGYRLDVIKYLEKPVQQKPILDLLDLALLKINNKPCLLIKQNGEDISIPFCSIIFIEQQGRNLIVHATGNNIYKTNDKIDKLESYFDSQQFIRCHKSYLVNLNYIKSIDKELSVFVMKEGGNVHIRRESFSTAKNIFENHLFTKTREIHYEK